MLLGTVPTGVHLCLPAAQPAHEGRSARCSVARLRGSQGTGVRVEARLRLEDTAGSFRIYARPCESAAGFGCAQWEIGVRGLHRSMDHHLLQVVAIPSDGRGPCSWPPALGPGDGGCSRVSLQGTLNPLWGSNLPTVIPGPLPPLWQGLNVSGSFTEGN